MSINLQNAIGGNLCVGSAALTGLSGAATTYSTSAIATVIRGIQRAKAAVAGGATPTTDAVSGAAMTLVANQAAVFVWGVNAAGTVQVIKGATVPYTDTTAGSTEVKLPALPDTFCPIAYVVIKAGATTVGTWTFGSSNWNATGIVVDAVANLFGLPDAAIFTA
jgi:hypothetical protein